MSIKVTRLVWKNYHRGGNHKLVLLALADFADESGEKVFPSVETIARMAACSIGQARRVIHALQSEGVIDLVGEPSRGRKSNTYRIDLARLNTCADARVADVGTLASMQGLEAFDSSPTLAPVQFQPLHGGGSTLAPVQANPLEELNTELREWGETLHVSPALASSKKGGKKKASSGHTEAPEQIAFSPEHHELAKAAQERIETAWQECRSWHLANGKRRVRWAETFSNWLIKERKHKGLPDPRGIEEELQKKEARERARREEHGRREREWNDANLGAAPIARVRSVPTMTEAQQIAHRRKVVDDAMRAAGLRVRRRPDELPPRMTADDYEAARKFLLQVLRQQRDEPMVEHVQSLAQCIEHRPRV